MFVTSYTLDPPLHPDASLVTKNIIPILIFPLLSDRSPKWVKTHDSRLHEKIKNSTLWTNPAFGRLYYDEFYIEKKRVEELNWGTLQAWFVVTHSSGFVQKSCSTYLLSSLLGYPKNRLRNLSLCMFKECKNSLWSVQNLTDGEENPNNSKTWKLLKDVWSTQNLGAHFMGNSKICYFWKWKGYFFFFLKNLGAVPLLPSIS